MLLGEILAAPGNANREQIDFALSRQRRKGGRGTILMAIGVSNPPTAALRIQPEARSAAA
jgi:hypothetical protein